MVFSYVLSILRFPEYKFRNEGIELNDERTTVLKHIYGIDLSYPFNYPILIGIKIILTFCHYSKTIIKEKKGGFAGDVDSTSIISTFGRGSNPPSPPKNLYSPKTIGFW